MRSLTAWLFITCAWFSFGSARADDAVPQPLSPAAYQASDRAYRAVADGDLAAAEQALTEALALQPGQPQLRRQWAQLLVRQQRYGEAVEVLQALVEQAPDDGVLWLELGFARQAAGQYAQAVEAFTAALARELDPDQQRSARLGAVDAALAAGQDEQALELMTPLGEQVDYAVHARRAQALEAAGRHEDAIAAWRLAEQASEVPAEKAAAIRSRAEILRDLGRDEDGNREILAGVQAYPDNHPLMLDAAYLAVAAHDDPAAYQRFAVGAADPDAPAYALVDAAYVANRLAHSDEAASYFRRSIDRFDSAAPEDRPFDEQQWFGMRRTVQEIERRWGFQAALFYRGSVFVPGVSANDVLQASVEAFWQPQGIGYRGGRIFQAFVRGIQTLDAPGLQDSSETLFGAVGVRYKPFGDRSLVLTAERVIGIGDLVDDDWLLRAGYSFDYGTDLEPWHESWTTVNAFAEAVRFLDAGRTVVGSQLRAGRSFAFGRESLVLMPHLSLAMDYDSAAGHEFAAGIGPAVSLRWWFRGNTYWAPPSYVDLQFAYRTALTSDDRVEGPAAQLVLYY